MIATIVAIYFIGTGASIGPPVVGAAVLFDLFTWTAVQNMVEAWATGTTADQEFWKDDE